jgi:hypothetical protein
MIPSSLYTGITILTKGVESESDGVEEEVIKETHRFIFVTFRCFLKQKESMIGL